jgi:hypothetical protein
MQKPGYTRLDIRHKIRKTNKKIYGLPHRVRRRHCVHPLRVLQRKPVVLNHRTHRQSTPPTPCGLRTHRLSRVGFAVTDTPETPRGGGNKPPWRRRYGSLWRGRQSHRCQRSQHSPTHTEPHRGEITCPAASAAVRGTVRSAL